MTQQVAETPQEWGLLACGSSGQWQIDVDESLDCEAWELQIEGPQTYLRFAIADLRVIPKLLSYLQGNAKPESDGIELGRFGSATVSILRDDEFATRWFLRLAGEAGSTLRVTLDADDVRMIVDALGQVVEQMA